MVMGCGIVSTALLMADFITGDQFVQIIIGTIGAFVLGNAVEKYMGGRGE